MSSGESGAVARRHLARVGGAAAVCGALTLFAGTSLHPMQADPDDPIAAFAEYAADRIWVWSHLLQFAGLAALGGALMALAGIVEEGRAAAWARLGAFGAASGIAAGAALQAVDGIALKSMVDRWWAASGEARALAFEGALVVRHIEIGLASLTSLLLGLTVIAFGVAIVFSRRFATALGIVAVVGGGGTVAAGLAQAHTGFSPLARTLSLSASTILLLWAVALGVAMWRSARREAS